MSRKRSRSDLNSDKRQMEADDKAGKNRNRKILEYAKQLINLTALQQSIANSLEKEVKNND